MSLQHIPVYARGHLSRIDSLLVRCVLSVCPPTASSSVLSRQSTCTKTSISDYPQVSGRTFAAQLQHNSCAAANIATQNFMPAAQVFRDKGMFRTLDIPSQRTLDSYGLRQLRGLSTGFQQAGSMCSTQVSQNRHSSATPQACRAMLAPRRGMATKPGRAALAQTARLQKRASEQGLYLVAMVVGMVGLTYASVPLYRCVSQPSSLVMNSFH